MSLSSTMTSLMNKARANYHITDKLSIANLTDLMDRPGMNSLLGIRNRDWTEASGWGSGVDFIVPVFKNVPICVTAEVKGIASTVSNQGPCLTCRFMDKDLNYISYWKTDKDGNYVPKNEIVQVGSSDDFSNKNGLRSSQRLFDSQSLRNVAYINVGIDNNVETSYSFRNLVVSYYKPYSFVSQVGGVIRLLLTAHISEGGCAA